MSAFCGVAWAEPTFDAMPGAPRPSGQRATDDSIKLSSLFGTICSTVVRAERADALPWGARLHSGLWRTDDSLPVKVHAQVMRKQALGYVPPGRGRYEFYAGGLGIALVSHVQCGQCHASPCGLAIVVWNRCRSEATTCQSLSQQSEPNSSGTDG